MQKRGKKRSTSLEVSSWFAKNLIYCNSLKSLCAGIVTNFHFFDRTPSVRISRRIKVPAASISESTGGLNLSAPNGQASGDSTPKTEAAELQKFETSVFPPSPPPDESLSSDMIDAGSPSIVNHVGHDSAPAKEVRFCCC